MPLPKIADLVIWAQEKITCMPQMATGCKAEFLVFVWVYDDLICLAKLYEQL